jgi:SPP1 gp7 family putative phage head morphogenesis protein
LPQYIIDDVKERADYILKGDGTYHGVDSTTKEVLREAIDETLPVEQALLQLRNKVTAIAQWRGALIAENEVARVVEKTRYEAYTRRGYNYKRWLTVADDRVRDSHRANEEQGAIPINDRFNNGNYTAGEDFRCRCTVVYSMVAEDINDTLS